MSEKSTVTVTPAFKFVQITVPWGARTQLLSTQDARLLAEQILGAAYDVENERRTKEQWMADVAAKEATLIAEVEAKKAAITKAENEHSAVDTERARLSAMASNVRCTLDGK